MSFRDSRQGFSLLELLVVLVIVGAVSALVVPRMTGTLSNTKLKTTVKEICATDPDCVIQPVDAWKKTGQGFVNVGLGTLIALGDAHGFVVEARAIR